MTAHDRGFDGVERRGLMFVLSSPSGAGKNHAVAAADRARRGLEPVGSATTRRCGRARSMVVSTSRSMTQPSAAMVNTMICWNGPSCSTIATGRRGAPVDAALSSGRDVSFDIDSGKAAQAIARESTGRRGQANLFCRRPPTDPGTTPAYRCQDADHVIRERIDCATHGTQPLGRTAGSLTSSSTRMLIRSVYRGAAILKARTGSANAKLDYGVRARNCSGNLRLSKPRRELHPKRRRCDFDLMSSLRNLFYSPLRRCSM